MLEGDELFEFGELIEENGLASAYSLVLGELYRGGNQNRWMGINLVIQQNSYSLPCRTRFSCHFLI
jgi:hypothetical protein